MRTWSGIYLFYGFGDNPLPGTIIVVFIAPGEFVLGKSVTGHRDIILMFLVVACFLTNFLISIRHLYSR